MAGDVLLPTGQPAVERPTLEVLLAQLMKEGKKAGVPTWVPILGSALLAAAGTWFTTQNRVTNLEEKQVALTVDVKEAKAEAVAAKDFARDKGVEAVKELGGINSRLTGIEADIRSLLREMQAAREAVKAVEASRGKGG